MKSSLDGQTIEIPCPHCGHKLRETIGKLKTNPTLTCTGCRGQIDINAADLRAKIKTIEKSLADINRSLGRLGK